jgi:hypothetical protein
MAAQQVASQLHRIFESNATAHKVRNDVILDGCVGETLLIFVIDAVVR